jgi:hypothetical protein
MPGALCVGSRSPCREWHGFLKMILLLAILVGLVSGVARAKIRGRQFSPPDLQLAWLLLLAVTPQLFTFHLPGTSEYAQDNVAAGILVSSQLLLLVFVWANRRLPGFWILGLGLGLNLLVIAINGGLMPISPETVQRLVPEAAITPSFFGTRLGTSKDILLPVTQTKLWWLSDWFVLPSWVPYRVAFSLGDIFIAIGAFWLFWVHGDIDKMQTSFFAPNRNKI